MSEETFKLSILTPSGLVVEETVKAVSLPSATGEVGILPNHANYTSLLGVGILEYWPASGGSNKLVVYLGFCNFSNGILKILADEVTLPEKVSKNFADSRSQYESILKERSAFEPEWIAARNRIAKIDAMERLVAR